MTTDFFRSTPLAAAFAQAGLTAVDIGSRGGFDPELLPIAWAVDGIGFEPDRKPSPNCRIWPRRRGAR